MSLFLMTAPLALADNSAWVYDTETTLGSFQASENVFLHPERTNLCEGVLGIPFGGDPGWVRVGGSPNPHTPVVEARGQVFPDLAGANDDPPKTNPFVTHTDNPFSHYSFDLNVFVTLDAGYRGLLASGNFDEGSENERAMLEVEWERGGVPHFAWPAARDRVTIWGPHIWDCGHGDEEPTYRTEIHPPVGWVAYRNTATTGDRDQPPPPGKRTQSPWVWYEPTDHQAAGATLPSSGLLNTPVKATVADAFFSSFGGNTVESLNGCDDSTAISDYTEDAPCLGIAAFLKNFEWMQPVLDRDYTFFVPAPPRPADDATLVWESENRCGEVPSDPGNPPGDDIDDVGEAGDGAENIGEPACNIPDEVVETTVNGQPGIEVTVKARSGEVRYPENGYIAFARRYKVAWDFVPPPKQRPRQFRVNVNHLRVYDDAEECGNDGEWNIAMRVNESWAYPVAGSGDDGDPFYAQGAVDDDKCILFHDPGYKEYAVGETFNVGVVPGEPLNLWERVVEIDPISNDVLPVINDFRSGPGSYEVGTTDHDREGAHTLGYTVTDASPRAPSLGELVIGDPRYGPNPGTGGRTYVSASSPITLERSNAAKIEYRFWKDGDPRPSTWTFDSSAPFNVNLSGASVDGPYTIEYAPVSSAGVVAQRRLARLELDATPPAITIHQPRGPVYTRSAALVLDYEVTDAGSGVNSVMPRLDGNATVGGHGLASGQAIDLLTELAIGRHTFEVDAADNLGNTSSSSITFSIIVTAESILDEVPEFLSRGAIKTPGLANSLLAKLKAAASASARRIWGAAANQYGAFINALDAQSGKGVTAIAATIMRGDALDLIAQLPPAGGAGFGIASLPGPAQLTLVSVAK
jgi:hypothetical protein